MDFIGDVDGEMYHHKSISGKSVMVMTKMEIFSEVFERTIDYRTMADILSIPQSQGDS